MLDLMGTFGEVVLIAVLAIILLKPEDLPLVMKFFNRCFNYISNLKSFVRDIFS